MIRIHHIGKIKNIIHLKDIIIIMYSFSRKNLLPTELIETLILTGLIFFGLHIAIQNYQVEGSSMHPTLKEAECVITNKLAYANINNKFIFASPKLGDIVIFEYPEDRNRNFVKRIVAQPGDTISMENGNVYINGNKLIESYVVNTGSTDYLPYLIKENEYFVLGDNRSASNDSRSWGTIKTEHLIGKYMFQYNSPMCSVIKYKSNEIQ
jgi:signal peptidase I